MYMCERVHTRRDRLHAPTPINTCKYTLDWLYPPLVRLEINRTRHIYFRCCAISILIPVRISSWACIGANQHDYCPSLASTQSQMHQTSLLVFSRKLPCHCWKPPCARIPSDNLPLCLFCNTQTMAMCIAHATAPALNEDDEYVSCTRVCDECTNPFCIHKPTPVFSSPHPPQCACEPPALAVCVFTW